MPSFAEKAIRFYSTLNIGTPLPGGVEVMNPYLFPPVVSALDAFFSGFYDDRRSRTGILGINPGRFGAGITGITFTDPVRLDAECGIRNPFKKRAELSSVFIYEVIGAFGGAEAFFGRYFLSAVCPLGFVRDGKNMNYYDDPQLEKALNDFIVNTLRKQIDMGLRTDVVICLGEGRNMKYLTGLNREHRLFGDVISLPHPRWVMQYRYRRRAEFVRAYLDVLRSLPV